MGKTFIRRPAPRTLVRAGRGAVAVETAIGAVVFILFISFIFDYGLIVHKQSVLFDMTLKTVQTISRDPAASDSIDSLEARAREFFEQKVGELVAFGSDGVTLESVTFDCDTGAVTVSTKWNTACLLCLTGGFHKTLHSKGAALVESPSGELECPAPPAGEL